MRSMLVMCLSIYLLNFISSRTKLLWWVVDAADGTMEVSTNRCSFLLTVDDVAVDKGRGACQVFAKLTQ